MVLNIVSVSPALLFAIASVAIRSSRYYDDSMTNKSGETDDDLFDAVRAAFQTGGAAEAWRCWRSGSSWSNATRNFSMSG